MTTSSDVVQNIPTLERDRYSSEVKREHNLIARAIIVDPPVLDLEDFIGGGSVSSNPRGLPHDPISEAMVEAYELEIATMREALRLLRAGQLKAAYKSAARAARLEVETERLKREYKARSSKRGGAAFDSNEFIIDLEGVKFTFSVTFLWNPEAERLEIADMDEIEARGNAAPHTPCWVDLARWVQRHLESEDDRIGGVDPNELVWFDNEGYLRPRAYITKGFPHLFRALEVLRRGLQPWNDPADEAQLLEREREDRKQFERYHRLRYELSDMAVQIDRDLERVKVLKVNARSSDGELERLQIP